MARRYGLRSTRREAVAALDRLRRRPPGPGRDAAADHPVQQEVDDEDPGRDLHHRERSEAAGEQSLGDERSDGRARGGADGDQREQPLALRPRIDLVRVRPELGDRREAEDPHPHEEDEPEVGEPGPAAQEEDLDAAEEEQEHRGQETRAREPLGHPSVKRDIGDEGEGLRRRRVGLQLRAPGEQDQRLARGLQDVIRGQEQEDVQAHQEDGRALAGPHVGEESQRALEPARGGSPGGLRRRVGIAHRSRGRGSSALVVRSISRAM